MTPSKDNVKRTLEPVGAELPDVSQIMTEIREEVKRSVSEQPDSVFSPFGTLGSAEFRLGDAANSDKLKTLNTTHGYSATAFRPETIESHRPIVGPFIVGAKRKLLAFLRNSIFKEYFEEQQKFNSALVQHLNDLTKCVDATYWQFRRSIDRTADTSVSSLRTAEQEWRQELAQSLQGFQANSTAASDAAAQHEARLNTLESAVTGLEQIISRISAPVRTESSADSQQPPADSSESETSCPPDYSYLMLENRFRGKEQDIKARLSMYPPYFTNAAAKVLEIGPGRGELLELFREANIEAYGVEIDQAMVEHCHSKNLDVCHEDGLQHLESLDAGSLGGLIATQVVEHLSQNQLSTLFGLCIQKLQPGSSVIFETINSRSLVALSHHYFRDPTHVWPLHPETMSYTVELSGLEVVEVREISPFPESALFKELSVDDFMTPRWAQSISMFNENIRRLNDLLYGFQDYCIIARVPKK